MSRRRHPRGLAKSRVHAGPRRRRFITCRRSASISSRPTSWRLGLEINWEPFDWGRRKHEVNEKTVEVEQSKLNLTQTKANVLVDVNKQFRALQEARDGGRRGRRPSRRHRKRSCRK